MNDGIRRAIFRAPAPERGWWLFPEPVERLVARTPAEVPALLERVQAAVTEGLWAAGYVHYEAASAFDRALETRPPRATAMAAFSFYSSPKTLSRGQLEGLAAKSASVAEIAPGISAERHAAAVAAIRAAIAEGETYQVNFTFPMRGRLAGEPEALFGRLAEASRAEHAAFLDTGETAIVSLSPELFFALDGERIAMRPMKGTRRRGRFGDEDRAIAAELGAAEKDRAENLMIVDMARNDLGRVARPGTVRATRLCEVERYPTVWQMTSTVEAETAAPLPEVFAALFPCASVTGAPKPRSMRWIARLEDEPRGVYCGAIGWVAPGARRASFSVAIRTATIERASGDLAYGVGSGVVWDSDAASEYDECLAKAKALDDPGEPLVLIETMRWSPRRGIRLADRHLARLAASADFWDIPFDDRIVRERLRTFVSGLAPALQRLRLELGESGTPALTSQPFVAERRIWRAVVAAEPVSSTSPLLFHKTDRRDVYDRALAEAKAHDADEVLLWNERGELTEGSRTNLLLELGGEWLTPALGCGLLPGVMRGWLLDRGSIREAVIRKEELLHAGRIAVVSALRGIVPVVLA